jgi:hypothetical protein
MEIVICFNALAPVGKLQKLLVLDIIIGNLNTLDPVKLLVCSKKSEGDCPDRFAYNWLIVRVAC